MEAYGSDGDIVASDTHLSISWKSLRGRLSSTTGAPIEVVAISDIYEVTLMSASDQHKGCLQLHLYGNPSNMEMRVNWMSNLHLGILTHVVTFESPAQFQFNALASHIQNRINILKSNRLKNESRSGFGK